MLHSIMQCIIITIVIAEHISLAQKCPLGTQLLPRVGKIVQTFREMSLFVHQKWLEITWMPQLCHFAIFRLRSDAVVKPAR